MKIYTKDNVEIADVLVTKEAKHEEEMMKSDSVQLSWSSTDSSVIPVDAYIIPFSDNVKYSLLEPYTPEQKNDCEFKYEPKFQHPKMYLSKVTFALQSTDAEGNPITLLDWQYSGFIGDLLAEFCKFINNVYGYSEEEGFTYYATAERC